MGHHVHALPPPLLQPMPKTEKPRWRPRVRLRKDGTPATDEAEGASGTDEVYAATTQSADKAPRKGPINPQAGGGRQRRGGGIAAALSDDTLRAVLAGQEDVLNGG